MTATLPRDFIIRPATMDDLNAVAELLITCERADYGESESTLESTAAWILSVWQCPGFILEKDSFVIIAPGDRRAGYVTVWHPENDLAELVASPRVHPDYCGLGIGSYLLRQGEVRARELMSNAPPDARVALYTWVDGGNQVAPHLVEQEGFTLLRYFLRMEIEMDVSPPIPTWPFGLTVRTFSPGSDDRAVFDATEDAFQDEPGYEPGNFAEWTYWLFTRDNFDPTLCFLAVDGDEIAGTALCRHDVGDRGGTGWISDVGVRPRWRKKGLGLALLHHAFDEFYRRGIRRCSLSVDVQNLSGAIRLYERAGMHPSRRAEIRYEKELRPGAEPHV